MFSKPLVIAASAASAQAALMAVSTFTMLDTTGTGFIASDAAGCGLCLSMVGGVWISATTSGTYKDPSAADTVSFSTNTLTGEVCCKSANTEETAGTNAKTICTAVFTVQATPVNTQTKYTANDYFQATIAQCPMNTTNCTSAGLLVDAKTAITITDKRYVPLDKLGSYVTLSMKVLAAPGTAPSLKQRKGDVCTWVVAAKCDAPVITVPKESGALKTDATKEFDIQVTEWSGEFTPTTSDVQQGATWLPSAQTGTTKYYPPLGKDLSAIITDLQVADPAATAPNNLMGKVGYSRPTTTTEYLYEKIPGNSLVDWITWLESVYTSYNAEIKTYDAERTLWKTYAEYKAPAPGLFGPTADPDAPKTMSAPRAPTQPVDVPASIAGLGGKTPTVEYNGKAGYGWPSAYKLVPMKEKTIRPFGTLAGKGQLKTTTVAIVDADKGYSMRATTNKDSSTTDGYKATCDKSYLMITGWLLVTPAAALDIQLKVTAEEFSKTLAERVPTRPGAATAAVAAPAGAVQLAASAVAAALTALYLF